MKERRRWRSRRGETEPSVQGIGFSLGSPWNAASRGGRPRALSTRHDTTRHTHTHKIFRVWGCAARACVHMPIASCGTRCICVFYAVVYTTGPSAASRVFSAPSSVVFSVRAPTHRCVCVGPVVDSEHLTPQAGMISLTWPRHTSARFSSAVPLNYTFYTLDCVDFSLSCSLPLSLSLAVKTLVHADFVSIAVSGARFCPCDICIIDGILMIGINVIFII